MIVAKHHETPGSIIVSIAGRGVVAIIIISFIQRLVAPHNHSYNYYYYLLVPENLINYGAYLQPGGGEGQRLIKKHITWLSTQSLLEVNQAITKLSTDLFAEVSCSRLGSED